MAFAPYSKWSKSPIAKTSERKPYIVSCLGLLSHGFGLAVSACPRDFRYLNEEFRPEKPEAITSCWF